MSGEFWVMLGSLLTVVIVGLWAFINRKGSEKFQGRAPLPATYEQMWARLTVVETEVENLKNERRALRNILYDLADQWPTDRSKPLLNQDDLDALGDTMPHNFRTAKPRRV